MTGEALLEVCLQNVLLGGRVTLRNIRFSVGAGEVVGLLGPNGAGKSTLLRAACGLIPFDGSVTVEGRQLGKLSGRQRARMIAYVPQEHDVAWPIRAADLVALGLTSRRMGLASKLTAEDERAVSEAMRRMDVTHLASRAANALSGGEKARVLIARALAQEPPLLMADEPAAGLDPLHQIKLMKTFRDLAADGRAVVLSMHDLGLAARWCTRLILLREGEIIADGEPVTILQPDVIAKVYGVSAHVATVNDGLIVQVLDPIATPEQDAAS